MIRYTDLTSIMSIKSKTKTQAPSLSAWKIKLHAIPPEKQKFMEEAIRLPKKNMDANKGGPFAAVIVQDGEIIAKGANLVTSINDPTAHAEITAIRTACQVKGDFQLDDCEIYTSCEPCPMCLAAIYWARISVVYYANTKEDAAKIGFDDHYIYTELEKDLPKRNIQMHQICREEAIKVFEEWEVKEDKIEY